MADPDLIVHVSNISNRGGDYIEDPRTDSVDSVEVPSYRRAPKRSKQNLSAEMIRVLVAAERDAFHTCDKYSPHSEGRWIKARRALDPALEQVLGESVVGE